MTVIPFPVPLTSFAGKHVLVCQVQAAVRLFAEAAGTKLETMTHWRAMPLEELSDMELLSLKQHFSERAKEIAATRKANASAEP